MPGDSVGAEGGKTTFRGRWPKKKKKRATISQNWSQHFILRLHWKAWPPKRADILSIPNWTEFMGNLTAAVLISPLGSFLHRWGSHSTAPPVLMQPCNPVTTQRQEADVDAESSFPPHPLSSHPGQMFGLRFIAWQLVIGFSARGIWKFPWRWSQLQLFSLSGSTGNWH